MLITDKPGLLGLLLLYVSVMVFLGWLGRRKTHGVADYYVGGRSLGGVTIGLSFFATYASTNSYLGFSSKAYSYGALWFLLVPAAVLFSGLAWIFVAPRLRQMTADLDSITIPDFIGFRFSSVLARTLAAVIVLIASLLYMTAVYKGIGNLLEILLGISYAAAIALVFLVVVAYTSVGGFHSVVRTDAVQAVFMLLAAIVLFLGISRAAGGVGAIKRLTEAPETASLLSTHSAPIPFGVLLGIVVASTIKFLVEPRQLSRFYALKNPEEAKRGVWVSTFLFVVVFSLLVPLGLYGRLIIEDLEDTDRLVPMLVTNPEYFGAPAQALLLLALISAALSSLDSVLLVMASTCQRDLAERVFKNPSESARLRATRVFVVLFAAIAATVALDPPGGIVELTSFSGALYGACFLPTILFGLYWKRCNGTMVLSSMIAGAATLLVWPRFALAETLHEVFPAILVSFAAYLLAAQFDRREAGGAESA